jgi:6,7-dimethyl-8-ribityllumazine synthase
MAGPRQAKRDSKSARNSATNSAKNSAKGARILIVEARYYDDIADALLTGAKKALQDAGAQFDLISVPGSLEIPPAIAIALDAAQKKRRPYDGAVALGCVIRGETIHFEIVSQESARGLLDLSVARRIPIGNGIVTVENEAQAKARADVDDQDKGGGAARAALALVSLKKRLGTR